MKPILGIDLNGVHDALVTRFGEDQPEEIDLGIRGGFIRLQAHEGRWLGGMQIAQAPHGRGAGWGQIGAAANRIDILTMLDTICTTEPEPQMAEAVASALPDLIGEVELAVFAVPDVPSYNEAFRDRYLRLLRQVNDLRPLLLWRPVAALLGWLATKPVNVQQGMNVAIISLMADGAHLSVLSLEEDVYRDVPLLVPQRSRPGRSVNASFRGARLIEAGRDQLANRLSGLSRDEVAAAAMAPWRAAVGVGPQCELMRLASNRGWLQVPELITPCPNPDPADLLDEVAEWLSTADILLVEGPFASHAGWRQAVLKLLSTRGAPPEPETSLDANLVARGCLEAATRHRLGQPIYFDFLPQLEIDAMVGNTPQFVDLIASGKRCRGGQPFRAVAPGNYAIGKGATRLTFWLFKEDYERGRKAEVDLPVEADRQYPLTVSVEQIPGQGFAQVRISSPEFEALRQSPITLDWTRMEEISQSREEILAEIEGQTGLAWPDTDVKQGHPFLWLPQHPKGDLIKQLAAYRAKPLFDGRKIDNGVRSVLQTLRQRFSQPDTPSFLGRRLGIDIAEPGSFRALDSDGSLPAPASGLYVPEGAGTELDATLTKLEEDFSALQRRYGQRLEKDFLGDLMGFASWCFWRCPPGVADVLLETYAGEQGYDIHHILLREGVARVVSTTDQLKRYFKGVGYRLQTTGGITAAEYSGLSRVLGTSEQSAVLLDYALANGILQVTIEKLAEENREGISTAYKKGFKAALLMLAALLRHRKAEPTFLDPDGGYAVRPLLATLDEAKGRNRDFAERKQEQAKRTNGQARTSHLAAARRFAGNAEIIVELEAFIHLEGRDPNIIRRIDALEEED